MGEEGPAPGREAKLASGEEVNLGAPTPPRQAASVILLRDGPEGVEVLLVERNEQVRFMGGAWVFPGGALHDEDAGHAEAAARELEEEASIRLAGAGEVVPYSRWITPAEVKTRFDTWFFVAAAPAGAESVCDGAECVDAGWFRPADALARHARGELKLVFPTIKHLEALLDVHSVEHALESARGREVTPITPRVVMLDGGPRVLLPGEPGYEE